jgi:hypothetical protein
MDEYAVQNVTFNLRRKKIHVKMEPKKFDWWSFKFAWTFWKKFKPNQTLIVSYFTTTQRPEGSTVSGRELANGAQAHTAISERQFLTRKMSLWWIIITVVPVLLCVTSIPNYKNLFKRLTFCIIVGDPVATYTKRCYQKMISKNASKCCR